MKNSKNENIQNVYKKHQKCKNTHKKTLHLIKKILNEWKKTRKQEKITRKIQNRVGIQNMSKYIKHIYNVYKKYKRIPSGWPGRPGPARRRRSRAGHGCGVSATRTDRQALSYKATQTDEGLRKGGLNSIRSCNVHRQTQKKYEKNNWMQSVVLKTIQKQ